MRLVKIIIALGCISICSCAYIFDSEDSKFASSGTLVVSLPVPSESNEVYVSNDSFNTDLNSEANGSAAIMAPLLGYLPPIATYLPSDNEVWIQIDSVQSKIAIFKGTALIREFAAEGQVPLDKGDYFVQLKQKDPIWYAPDNYFVERELMVPGQNDRTRYRRGALGKYAIYPTNNFAIHSAPVWSNAVGGLRVSAADLASIYYLVPLGAPIVVK